MEKMQFSAVVLFMLLTLQLTLLMPGRVGRDKILNRSRWYLALGTCMLAVQFLLQYMYGFRTMGITQAVMVNLIFFVPCTILFNMTMLNLQQQGRVEREIWIVGMTAMVTIWALLGGAVISDGIVLTSESRLLRQAEYISGIIYSFMQIYFVYHLLHNDRRLRRSLDSYYDFFSKRRLMWFRRVAFMITLLALAVPFLIFSSSLLLKIYSVTIFFTIFYLVTTFTFYCVSNDASDVKQAEEMENEEDKETEEITPLTLSYDDKKRIAHIVEQWVADGRYLHIGLTIQRVADDMKIPRNQLAMWLKTTQWELFNPWMTHLRIEEAKRMLKEHEDWSNDAVAQQCGFASRNYFQQVFKKSTGLTPAQYAEKVKSEK